MDIPTRERRQKKHKNRRSKNRVASKSRHSPEDLLDVKILSTPVYEKRVVIAIDFGSTHCGIAYSMVTFLGVPPPISVSGDEIDRYSILEPPDVYAKVSNGKYDKDPTCAMFSKSKEKLIKFGREAYDGYLQLLLDVNDDNGESSETLQDIMFFEGRDIKMRLWEKVNLPFEKILVKSQDGKSTMSLLRLVGSILRKLKEDALSLASRALVAQGEEEAFKAEDALWVLTVPSIWQEADKNFMRKAAHFAGIIMTPESPDLILALEPECAVIAAVANMNQTANRNGTAPSPANNNHVRFENGDKVLTLDCGGGTVDICAVQVVSDGLASPSAAYIDPKSKSKLRQKLIEINNIAEEDKKSVKMRLRHLIEPCGGNWGSTYIDRKFQEFLEIFLKDPGLSRLRRCDPGAVLDIYTEFESIKTSITGREYRAFKTSNASSNRSINMAPILHAINTSNETENDWNIYFGNNSTEEDLIAAKAAGKKITLQQILEEFQARAKITDIDESYLDGLSVLKNNPTQLVLPLSLIASFFNKVISHIIDEVEEILTHDNSETRDIKYVLLVGGFAESDVLREELRAKLLEINPLIQLLTPSHPGQMVQNGAVHYGFDPRVISTRRARQTIGVKVTMRWDDALKFEHLKDVLLEEEKIRENDREKEEINSKNSKKAEKNSNFHIETGRHGDKVVKDIFNIFIHKGEEIATSHIVTRRFMPATAEPRVKFDIYSTDDLLPKFITDEGCIKLTKLVVPIEEGTHPELEFQMSFASTEIIARVKNLDNNVVKEVMLQYSNLDLNDEMAGNESLVQVKVKDVRNWEPGFDSPELEEREYEKRGVGFSKML